VTTVDAYCAAQGIERVDYLKVDSEGHDLAVLQGAAGMLEVGVYRVSRMLTDGLEAVEYSERDEVFLTTNFLAELA